MAMTRRNFLARSTAGLAGMGLAKELLAMKATAPKMSVGICDWSAGLRGEPAKAMQFCKELGLDCLQISPKGAAETLSYAAKPVQAQYKKLVKSTGVQLASVGLTVTNGCPLATDERGAGWLIQTIDTAAALGCTSTLIAFFGKGALKGKGGLKKAEVDAVVAKLKAAAPHAKAKGVRLGLENTLSAKENLAIIDRVGSEQVQVYYDIANSTGNGYDVPAEIRMLKGRICEFHLKNTKGAFGESGIRLQPVKEAICEIGFAGALIMERSFGGDKKAYFAKNAARIREVFELPAPKTA